jgi:hypothetical protein
MAGVWLALLLIKPNITLIPVMAIAIWLMRRRNWRPVVSMCVLTLGLLVAASLVTPNWYQSLVQPGFGQGLFDRMDGPGQLAGPRLHTTLGDWLTMFGVSGFTSRAIAILAFFGGLVFLASIVWKSHSLTLVVVASLLAGFAITPYAFQYDYPLLTLVLFWAIALARHGRQQWTPIVAAAIVVFIASVPFWERPISDGYWMVIGLVGLTAWSWYNVQRSQVPAYLL